ncbi:T9SS type A sorting domain-containing protein [bacterium SCSIO 12741]|nr:T9SS type A sorting domain-containing protein [bacterium SCSIO 12741]
MKNVLSIALLLLSGSLLAQPDFTKNDMPDIGDQDTILYLTYHAITNDLDAETGNGYNWDFSDLMFNLGFYETDSFRTKQHPVSSTHPTATIEEFRQGSAGQFVSLFSYRNDTLFQHRTGGVSSGTSFNPPLASIVYPIGFNQSSDVTAPIFVGANQVGERRTTTDYDGFGTLKMPGNTNYSNVFRIKKVEVDTNYILKSTTTYTQYIWYKQGGGVPILRLLYSGASNLYFVYGNKTSEGGGAPGPSALVSTPSNESIDLFPNPAKTWLQVTGGDLEKVEIWDQSGRKMETQWQADKISVEDYPQGVYFLRASLSSGQLVQKRFIKN